MGERAHDELTPRPPDRGGVPTEARLAESAELDRLSVEDGLRVINDQDATIAAAVREAIPAIADFVRATAERMERGGRLIYAGCGTSGRLGVLDASECPPTFMTDPGRVVGVIAGGDPALRRSSEGLEDVPEAAPPDLEALGVGEHDALLGVTAGGTTPWVLGAIRMARERGAFTGLLTCGAPDGDAGADVVIEIRTGAEVVTGSTRMKAGTATKMALNMISTGAMVQLGKTHGNLMVDLRATNEKLRDRAARIVSTLAGVDREEAFGMLDEAGGAVKTALVMRWRGVTRDEAELLLARAHGRLREAAGGAAP